MRASSTLITTPLTIASVLCFIWSVDGDEWMRIAASPAESEKHHVIVVCPYPLVGATVEDIAVKRYPAFGVQPLGELAKDANESLHIERC